MADKIQLNPPGSFANAFAVTPHDTNPLARIARALYVGGAGAITCRPYGATADVVFSAVPAGSTIPLAVTHVRSTGTAATGIVALTD